MATRSQTPVAADESVAFAGAARQAEMVRAGEVSPKELVELSLRRIERYDPTLNAFRKVFAEKALLEAEQAEARLKAGEERPLLGVPIAIKDEVDVAGEVKTIGTDAFSEPAKEDCEMVRRLREAGAIVVGLTLPPEMAICGFTESATYGVTRNPWNLQRTPGGSSGGSASAVAAGLVPIASAGDGAGSIRIPAASCGLFGLKPSRGRVSLAPDLEGWKGLAVNNCLSRSVLDTALFLDIVSGGSREPEAPRAPDRPFVESAKDVARQAPHRLLDARPPEPAAANRLGTGQAGRRRRRGADAVAGTRRRPERPRVGPHRQTTSRLASYPGSARRSTKPPIPSASNDGLGVSAASAGCSRRPSTSVRCAAARPTSPVSTQSSTRTTC